MPAPVTRAEMDKEFKRDSQIQLTPGEQEKLLSTVGGGLIKLKKKSARRTNKRASRRRNGGKLKENLAKIKVNRVKKQEKLKNR